MSGNTPASPSRVVITRAEPLDYRRDYAALPREYGTPGYFARPDVRAIFHALEDNLTVLDEETDFTRSMAGRKLVLKPNLVTVYSSMGLVERDYPESTDPRVLDALVAILKPYVSSVVIAESSGRGVPTRGSFRVAGLDRLARYHGIELVALEEQPVDRYFVPRARVQRDTYVPRLFSEIIRGEAFYISAPKLKTNLYTGVTLGFKNAMGVLPYNLRQRGHHYALEQKLVDLLYLFQPDLTVIDGIVGGEGNCPAPVDPVDSRVIISGNHPVETDRVAARLMGFDPEEIALLRLADEAGFGDPNAQTLGEMEALKFRRADPSLSNAAFRKDFPNVRSFFGHPFQAAVNCLPDSGCGVEGGCRGGCLATTRFAFDMFMREGLRHDFALVILMGRAMETNQGDVYLDGDGQPWRVEEILRLPGRKLAVGSCARGMAERVDRFVDGCMPYPNAPHAALHRLTGTLCRVTSPRNAHLLPLLVDTLRLCETRKRLIRSGERLDVERPMDEDAPGLKVEGLSGEEAVQLSLPPLTPVEIRRLCAEENRAVLSTFLG